MTTNTLARAKRAFRLATALIRPLPQYLILGGIKCGTTSLHEFLVDSASITGGSTKEVHFFDANFDRGPRWYRSWFGMRSSWSSAIDSSPTYFGFPPCAGRVSSLLPSAQVLVVLRDPTERTISHLRWRGELKNREHSAAELASLAIESAQQANEAALRSEKLSDIQRCYIQHSEYDTALDRWRRELGDDRVCVLISEKLFAADPNEFDILANFLARDGVVLGQGKLPHRNLRRFEADDEYEQELDSILRPYFLPSIYRLESMLGRPTGWIK